MLERLYFVIEIISVFYLGAHFINKKFEADVLTLVGMSVNIIIMELINEKLLLRPFVFVCYFAIYLCFYIKYQKGVLKTLAYLMATFVTMAIIQAIVAVFVYQIVRADEQITATIINSVTLVLIFVAVKTKLADRIKDVWLAKRFESMVFLEGLLVLAVVIAIVYFKLNKGVFPTEFITLVILTLAIVIFFVLLVREHGKYLLEKHERKIDELYSDAFKSMISEIRNKQHGFDNHINAMAGICYTSDTVDEIREKMSEYTKFASQSNRLNKLIGEKTSPIIAAFVFGKLEKADETVDVETQLTIAEAECCIRRYQLIEIIGVLIDNALEAENTVPEDERKVWFKMTESDDSVEILTGNTFPFVKTDELVHFFHEGYSTKGKNRGLGLYGVKKIVEKNKGMVSIDNVVRNEKNGIEIKISIPK